MSEIFRISIVIQVVRDLDATLPVQDLHGFLYITNNPGCRVTDLQNNLGVSSASATRIVHRLGHFESKGRVGLGLITVETDKEDRRQRCLWLSTKGQKLVKRMESAMN